MSRQAKTLFSDVSEVEGNGTPDMIHASLADGHAHSRAEVGVRLKRRLGLLQGVAVICALTIGSGIYITPQKVLQLAGSPAEALVLWGIGGLISATGALVYAELGTTFPQSGARYNYLQKFYGPFLAFLDFVMTVFLFRPAADAIKCLLFSTTAIQWAFTGCQVVESGRRLVAMVLIGPLMILNIINVKWSASLITFLTSISILALTAIAATGLVYIGRGDTQNIEIGFEGSTTNPGHIAFGIYYVIFSFAGWIVLNFILEELKDPYRNLPRAILISQLLVTVLYVLVNVAYLNVLGVGGMISSEVVAVAFAEKAFGVVGLIMPVVIALNMIGNYNAGTVLGSRLTFVGARQGHLPEFLSYINVKYSTPIISLIFQALLVIPMVLWFDTFSLLNNIMFATQVGDILVVVGLIRHRNKYPDFHRPLKMPTVVIVVYLVACVVLLVIPLVAMPKQSAVGLLLITCLGVPYYVIFIAWENKPLGYRRMIARLNHVVQKVFICVYQEVPIDK